MAKLTKFMSYENMLKHKEAEEAKKKETKKAPVKKADTKKK